MHSKNSSDRQEGIKPPVVDIKKLYKLLRHLAESSDPARAWMARKKLNQIERRIRYTKPSRKFNEIRRVMHKQWTGFRLQG